MSNKYLYNFKNVHYALTTVNAQGKLEFSTPKRLPGTVEFTMELDQSSEKHYSEGLIYFVTNSAAGYKGEITLYNVTPEFEQEVLGIKKDAKGVLYEDMYSQPKEIALLFEVDGNEKAERHCMYRLQFSKPKMEFKTTTEKSEVPTLKMSYEGLTNEDGVGRVKTAEDTDQTTYNNWYNAVYSVTPQKPTRASGQ